MKLTDDQVERFLRLCAELVVDVQGEFEVKLRELELRALIKRIPNEAFLQRHHIISLVDKTANANEYKEAEQALKGYLSAAIGRVNASDELQTVPQVHKAAARAVSFWRRKRERADAEVKKELFEKQRGRCYFCGDDVDVPDAHLDHLGPVYWGGSSSKDNLRYACAECNLGKAHLPVGAFTTIETYVPESGHVTDRLRFAVLMRDGFKCTACHEVASARALVVRLIVSEHDGGTQSLDNLNTVCRRCNNIGTADRE